MQLMEQVTQLRRDAVEHVAICLREREASADFTDKMRDCVAGRASGFDRLFLASAEFILLHQLEGRVSATVVWKVEQRVDFLRRLVRDIDDKMDTDTERGPARGGLRKLLGRGQKKPKHATRKLAEASVAAWIDDQSEPSKLGDALGALWLLEQPVSPTFVNLRAANDAYTAHRAKYASALDKPSGLAQKRAEWIVRLAMDPAFDHHTEWGPWDDREPLPGVVTFSLETQNDDDD